MRVLPEVLPARVAIRVALLDQYCGVEITPDMIAVPMPDSVPQRYRIWVMAGQGGEINDPNTVKYTLDPKVYTKKEVRKIGVRRIAI